MRYLLFSLSLLPFASLAQNSPANSLTDSLDNVLISMYPNDNQTDTPTVNIDTHYMEEMPQPPVNVYNFVNSNLRYPRDASKEGIEGRVYVQFIVKEDGYLDSIRILKGQLPSMNKEALRLAKLLPQPWKPGKNLQGQPAKSWYMLPVTFHLE